MKRTCERYLYTWAKELDTRKPLIIRGARQVGKTYTVDTLSNDFTYYLKIDFEETPSLKTLFEGDLNVNAIVTQLCAIQGIPYDPSNTLFFLDEIQECPDALKALRYFYEKMPELAVIAAGSLLELSIGEYSFPVGRVSFYWMYPLTFQEFVRAKNLESLLEYIPNLSSTTPVPEVIHTKLLELLKEYYLVGGMPEAVKSFIQTSSYTQVKEVQNSIIQSYVEDITKHYPGTNRQLISRLFYQSAQQVGKQIKYTKLIPGERSDTIKAIVEKFYKVLILHPVYASNGEHPFKVSADPKLFKFVFLDIGLMQNMCGIRADETFFTTDLMATYEGALAEQFVGQEAIALNTKTPPELYYWTRQKQNGSAEIDYLFEGSPITPIEVKSAKAGKLKSMHQALIQFDTIPYGVVLSTRNAETLDEQKLRFLPLYTMLSR